MVCDLEAQVSFPREIAVILRATRQQNPKYCTQAKYEDDYDH